VKVISGTNSLESPFCSVVSDGCVVRHNVTEIKRQAFLMAGSIVLPGVTVHEGAALASGAVATQDIPEWEVWAGVPAKFVRKRRFREGVPA